MSDYITDDIELGITIAYPDPADPMFAELRQVAGLMFTKDIDELLKVKQTIGYAHSLFGHDSDNEPSLFEPVTIIKEAQHGKTFRCMEYSLLATALLWAYDIPARIVGLKSSHVETNEYGAGHVVLEYWNSNKMKWVMSDVQAGIIPMQGQKLLSAVELGQALGQNQPVKYLPVDHSRFSTSDGFADDAGYSAWVKEYLFFYDVAPAPTFEHIDKSKEQILMLVPLGVTPPRVSSRLYRPAHVGLTAEFTKLR